MRKALTPLAVMAGGAATFLVGTAGPALADSGVIYSQEGDCKGQWLSGSGRFRLADLAGGDDNDHCYIDYGDGPENSDAGRRITIAEDSNIGQWQFPRGQDMTGIPVDSLYFQVCEEREDDSDMCSNIHGPYSLK
jgi:hypothetical protein